MKYFKYIVALAILACIGFYAFALNMMNPDAITVKLLPSYEWSVSMAAFMFGTFILGLASGALLLSFSLLGQKLKTGQAKRKLKKAEKEVEGLRAMPPEQASS